MKSIYLFVDGMRPVDAVLEAKRRGIKHAGVHPQSIYGTTVLETDLRDLEAVTTAWISGWIRRTAGSPVA
jgi:hypothetical protein